jgi:Tol biopolymer transport system component
MRRILFGGLFGLLASVAAAAVLPQVADDLPRPLADAARLPERLWTRVFPPRLSTALRLTELTDPERRAVRGLAGGLDALVTWSSNRSGNHELYVLDLRAQSVRRLTNHPNVDFFGRFSPDGQRLVFLRSQREWVSARDRNAWDVLVMNLDDRQERPIARGGYHPTWTADGRAVVFHRDAEVFHFDLATSQETLIFDGRREIRGMTEIGDFELAPDNQRLAFGLRGPFSGAAVFDLRSRNLVPLTSVQACQPTWAPGGESLVWVEIEGKGGTRLITGEATGRARRVFMDLPGAYSHEYFPKLSNDGRWLVWGAAAGGHEHDRADYEIFLWEVGTPAESAVRLTYHEGNDQWPDLWVRRRR